VIPTILDVPRALFPTLLAAVLVTGGCAADDPTTSTPAPARTSPAEPTQAASPTEQPATEPTEQKPRRHRSRGGGKKIAPTPLPSARRSTPAQHLLSAARLPALGDDLAWTVVDTNAEASEPTGACQKTSLFDIGALQALRREYAGPDGSGVAARQTVAKYADAKSAWRAEQVVRAWRDDCEERLDYRRKDVGPLAEVATDATAAGHYRLSYGSRRATDAAGTGIVRNGRWLTIVEITAASDDYPTGWSPARRAVRRIAATFA